MNIIVCVKQVPDTNEVKIDPRTGTIMREGVPSILNPDDAHALEAALSLKDDDPSTHITVLTMGPPQAAYMLRQCLAMGADKAALLSDRAFAGADTWATSNTLAAAVKKLGGADVILAGRQAIDGDTAQVGPQIATRLGLPQVTYVQHIRLQGRAVTVRRQLEDGYEIIELPLPCLLTVVKELNAPRYMSVGRIVNAYKQDITVWGLADLGLTAEEVGLNASPTQVLRSFTPPAKGQGQKYTGLPRDMVSGLLTDLRAQHVL